MLIAYIELYDKINMQKAYSKELYTETAEKYMI